MPHARIICAPFATAISSTSPTAPKSVQSASRKVVPVT
jgi:hypothetical protein